VSDPLPELLDAKTLRAELGVTRAAAEALMRRLPIVTIEGLRKVYVRRDDVARYLEEHTFAKNEVPCCEGPGAGGGVSATPTATPTRGVVSQTSATPIRGGEDG
jgi:hypothetical protein